MQQPSEASLCFYTLHHHPEGRTGCRSDDEQATEIADESAPQSYKATVQADPALPLELHIPLRLLCGGLLFTCNAVMWTFLAKALRYSSSSTRTTVTTTASNFVSSAFLGQLIFGEAQITLWWVGISLTFSGLLVLQRVSPQEREPDPVAKREE
ncbi:transmembrane protein 42 isoform X2 [Corythoichthys intestinalis]|uniref:transmembrane protein 42 isoform X2 n=1 Tax=Corythoichthys intestinalis TaxID=161448 RepID=UPI0025A51DDE|nr:transmembrane protein 42 isoform X2 [Corythoichthys intestinalis]